MKIGTPNNIEVLLHHHTTPEVHPRASAIAVIEATVLLVEAGCIEPVEVCDGRFRTTPKGKAWVRALCNVEVPREVYVDAQGTIIE
jgi:hypothetical protein